MKDIFLSLSTAELVTGAVAFVLDPRNGLETAAVIDDRITPLHNGILLDNVTVDEVAKLVDAGLVVTTDGDMATVAFTAETAAKKKAKKTAKPARKSADERRAAQVNSGGLKFLKDRAAMNLVKKLFMTYVGQEEDLTHYVTFYRELDAMIAEYRIHTGVDQPQPLEIDEDDEEADDIEEDAVVASLNNDGTQMTVNEDGSLTLRTKGNLNIEAASVMMPTASLLKTTLDAIEVARNTYLDTRTEKAAYALNALLGQARDLIALASLEVAGSGKSRAKFLRAFFSKASGQFGDDLVAAFVNGDKEALGSMWGEVLDHLLAKMDGAETAAAEESSEPPPAKVDEVIALYNAAETDGD